MSYSRVSSYHADITRSKEPTLVYLASLLKKTKSAVIRTYPDIHCTQVVICHILARNSTFLSSYASHVHCYITNIIII